uniref:Uncharacterized protein n=1 Tax=Arundo donax TaxID=35708 RepID=A0A0A9FMG7_ARUDO
MVIFLSLKYKQDTSVVSSFIPSNTNKIYLLR